MHCITVALHYQDTCRVQKQRFGRVRGYPETGNRPPYFSRNWISQATHADGRDWGRGPSVMTLVKTALVWLAPFGFPSCHTLNTNTPRHGQKSRVPRELDHTHSR